MDLLEVAEAHRHAARADADIDGIGGVGADWRRRARPALAAASRAESILSMGERLAAGDRPTASMPRKTSRPQVRLDRNSLSAPSPSFGSARNAWLARCNAAGISASNATQSGRTDQIAAPQQRSASA